MNPDEKPRVASFAVFGRCGPPPGLSWRANSTTISKGRLGTTLEFNPAISHFLLRLSLTPGFSPCLYPHLPREGLSLTGVSRGFHGHRRCGFQFPICQATGRVCGRGEMGFGPREDDSGLTRVVATKSRIDHRQLDASKNGRAKKSSTAGIVIGQCRQLDFTQWKWVLPAKLFRFFCARYFP